MLVFWISISGFNNEHWQLKCELVIPVILTHKRKKEVLIGGFVLSDICYLKNRVLATDSYVFH